MSLTRAKKFGFICFILAAALMLIGLNEFGKSKNSPSITSKKTTPDTHLLAAHVDASVKAFDSANTISDPEWFTKAYAEGFRLYILNTTEWNGTCDAWAQVQPQIKNALAAGLKVAAYTRNPNCWSNGILATGPYQNQLQFFALDIETDPGVPATRAIVDGIKSMGVRPIIYTGSRMWPKLEGSLANSFADLPLWDTNPSSFSYDSWKANYLAPKPVEFGGWNSSSNMRVGSQQQFEYSLNGVKIDLDSFNATFLP